MLNRPPPNKEWKLPDMMPRFWNLLRLFWDEDRINKWRCTVFPNAEKPNTGVEGPFNLICLNPAADRMWNDGEFALKPLELSSDHTELTVQLFWQVPNKYQPETRIDLLTEPASSKGLNQGAGRRLFDCEDNRIRSGQVFSFKTTDPKKRPLPSWELLEMQWYLQRLVAMTGAAGWPILVWDDDNDDDKSIRCLDSTYADSSCQDVFE